MSKQSEEDSKSENEKKGLNFKKAFIKLILLCILGFGGYWLYQDRYNGRL